MRTRVVSPPTSRPTAAPWSRGSTEAPDFGQRPREARQEDVPRIKLARSMKLRVTPDEGSIGFEGMVVHTAAAHHYGKEDIVGRAPNGTSVRTRYPRRRLLGFAGRDGAMVGDVVLALLEK